MSALLHLPSVYHEDDKQATIVRAALQLSPMLLHAADDTVFVDLPSLHPLDNILTRDCCLVSTYNTMSGRCGVSAMREAHFNTSFTSTSEVPTLS